MSGTWTMSVAHLALAVALICGATVGAFAADIIERHRGRR